MKKLKDSIPFQNPRRQQLDVLDAIESAFEKGYTNVILEQPVGGGKSGVAMAIGKHFSSSHILTPRKSLQNQYYDDFGQVNPVVLMKGRSSYPCTYPSYEHPIYEQVVNLIRRGGIPDPKITDMSCAEGPCRSSSEHLKICTNDGENPCPYTVALQTAQDKKIIIHNVHSFIFQAYFYERFEKREVMIIDECHEIEGIVRGFSTKTITLPRAISEDLIPKEEDGDYPDLLEEWAEWLMKFDNLFSDNESSKNKQGFTARQVFHQNLVELTVLSEKFKEDFVPDIKIDTHYNQTKISFTPERVADLVNAYILSFGNKRIMMSGTIYNKAIFCKNIGLNPDDTCFIRTSSTFPRETRPIYCKKDYMVDTSHQNWDDNFGEMISKIKELFEVFDDVKGLIHTPSYKASQDIYEALRNTGRVMAHDKDNLQAKLTEFYSSKEPVVFLSPVCQQGVDFKYDRARFQIILRVPYANTSDAFNAYKVKNDFNWYNYQALTIFGQQIGRINRAPDDFGVTILMDERFSKFLSRNRNVLPKWVTDSIIYK